MIYSFIQGDYEGLLGFILEVNPDFTISLIGIANLRIGFGSVLANMRWFNRGVVKIIVWTNGILVLLLFLFNPSWRTYLLLCFMGFTQPVTIDGPQLYYPVTVPRPLQLPLFHVNLLHGLATTTHYSWPRAIRASGCGWRWCYFAFIWLR